MTSTSTPTDRAADAPDDDADARRPQPWWSRASAARFIDSSRVQYVVIAVILVNAATLGLETSDAIMVRWADLLHAIDHVCLAIFVVELAIKLYAFRLAFFKVAWNVFDLLVVAVALVPGSGAFGVLRSLRVLRVLRLVSMVPQLRRVVEALVKAVPGILSIGALLALLFYVSSVMATMLFGDGFDAEFGSISRSLFSLFQVMTLDGWSDLVRRVLEVYPWATAFFVPYVLLSAFTVLNLFIAVIVDAMQHLREDGEPTGPEALGTTTTTPTAEVAPDVADELRALRAQVAELTALVRSRG